MQRGHTIMKMNSEDIEIEIRKILAGFENLVKDADSIGVDEDMKSVGLSSLDVIKLAVQLEMKYDFEFDDEDLIYKNMCSIQRLIQTVLKICQ